MKKWTLSLLALLLIGMAQVFGQQGVKYHYLFELHGQKRFMDFQFSQEGENWKIDWQLRQDAGQYLMAEEALANAKKMNFVRGKVGGMVSLALDETCFLLISRGAFERLKAEGDFVYNDTRYRSLGEEVITVESQEIEVIHVVAEIDETEMWIRNDASWPMIVKMIKNPLGINYELKSTMEDER